MTSTGKELEEWKRVEKTIQNAQTQFLEAGEPSPITENYKNQLAWKYTPAGQLMDELIMELDKEEKDGE